MNELLYRWWASQDESIEDLRIVWSLRLFSLQIIPKDRSVEPFTSEDFQIKMCFITGHDIQFL